MINYRRDLSSKGCIILRTKDIYKETLPSLTHWYSMRKVITTMKFLIRNCQKLSFSHPLFHASGAAIAQALHHSAFSSWLVAAKSPPSHSFSLGDSEGLGQETERAVKKVQESRCEILHKLPDLLKIIFIEKSQNTQTLKSMGDTFSSPFPCLT